MPSIYEVDLPNAFPYRLSGDPDMIRDAVSELLDPNRQDVPHGSSFAVTVEHPQWTLWLSRASAELLNTIYMGRIRHSEHA